jgi:hypothetical protein
VRTVGSTRRRARGSLQAATSENYTASDYGTCRIEEEHALHPQLRASSQSVLEVRFVESLHVCLRRGCACVQVVWARLRRRGAPSGCSCWTGRSLGAGRGAQRCGR